MSEPLPRARRGAVVLCGGQSVRMGRDKAWLPFAGEALLTRVVARVAAAVPDVVVVARPGQEIPPVVGARVVRDDVPGQGPLGGLATGLRASRADAVFATGCDVPFVSAAVMDLLFGRLGGSEAAMAFDGDRACPLCAVYRTSAAPAVERLVREGRLRAALLADELCCVRVGLDEVRAADPELASLVNCNTDEGYREALGRNAP